MTAKLEWLNHYVPQSGQWIPGQPLVIESWNEVSFSAAAGRDLRIHETDRSGSVLLSPVGGPLMGYGDAEVFLTLTFANPPAGPADSSIGLPRCTRRFGLTTCASCGSACSSRSGT